jgi:tetratricopeptide (TPR) repeat protein
MALLPWSTWPVRAGAELKSRRDFGDLMEEAWEAFYTGSARLDYGYPIPYLDRVWAQLPQEAGNSVRAVLVEKKEELVKFVRDAENSLPSHRASVERNPSCWEPRYWLAFTLKRAGRYQEALEEYLTVAQITGCPDCLNDIGWCLYRKGRYEDARRYFERAKFEYDIPVPPFSGRMLALENRMLVYSQLGLRKQAAEAGKEYVSRYGRIGYPERRALAKIGIDADAIYLRQHAIEA